MSSFFFRWTLVANQSNFPSCNQFIVKCVYCSEILNGGDAEVM